MTLVVATPPTVIVPELVGAPEDAGGALLAQLGLTVPDDERVEQQSAAPSGTVLCRVAGARGAAFRREPRSRSRSRCPSSSRCPTCAAARRPPRRWCSAPIGLDARPRAAADPGERRELRARSSRSRPTPQTDTPVGTAVADHARDTLDGRDPGPGGADARRRRRGARRSGGRSDRDARPAAVAGGAHARRGRGAGRSRRRSARSSSSRRPPARAPPSTRRSTSSSSAPSQASPSPRSPA